jgi:hypothetical protein
MILTKKTGYFLLLIILWLLGTHTGFCQGQTNTTQRAKIDSLNSGSTPVQDSQNANTNHSRVPEYVQQNPKSLAHWSFWNLDTVLPTEDQEINSKILLLHKENELKQSRLNREEMMRNFFIGMTLVGICSLLFLFHHLSLLKKKDQLQLSVVEARAQIEIHKQDHLVATLEKEKTELEMQALRAQMSPHFIFNSLNSINRFILQNDRAQASAYLTKFSRLVRMILQNSNTAFITLESELDSLALYLDLESLRFDYRFGYKISVSPEVDVSAIKIPPLIIQPYAENAIWHGLMHREEKGQLDIDISYEEDSVFIRVADNGIGRAQAAAMESKSATLHKSLGLQITANRIALIEGSGASHASVHINDLVNPDGSAAGTEVIIKIPPVRD